MYHRCSENIVFLPIFFQNGPVIITQMSYLSMSVCSGIWKLELLARSSTTLISLNEMQHKVSF